MRNNKLNWENLSEHFSEFEKSLNHNDFNPQLFEFFNELSKLINDNNLDPNKLLAAKERLEKIRILLKQKMQQLKEQSTCSLTRYDNIKQYIKNANL